MAAAEKTPGKIKMKYKKSAKTRDSVFNAAISLMAEKGYQGATIRDICKRANVSPATFYSYFASKQEVLKEIYLPGDAFFRDIVSKQIEGKLFFDQLNIFTNSYAQLNVETGPEMLRVLFNPENEWFTRPRIMQDVLAVIIGNGKAEGFISPDLDVTKLVDDVFLVFRGVCYAWCISNSKFDLESRLKDQLNYLLYGIIDRRLEKNHF
jgi:TetR/AcrR family fatty acid metabolism transcriptional regulator